MNKNTDRYIKENSDKKILYCGKLLLPERDLSQIKDGSAESLVISVSPAIEDMPKVFRISETLCGENSDQDVSNEIELSFEIIRKLYRACSLMI